MKKIINWIRLLDTEKTMAILIGSAIGTICGGAIAIWVCSII